MKLFNNKCDDDLEYDKRPFEQYKIYVDLADRVSQRRPIANKFIYGIIKGGCTRKRL